MTGTSSKEVIRAKMTPAPSEPPITGTTTCRKASTRLAPSTRAASSNAGSSPLKPARVVRTT